MIMSFKHPIVQIPKGNFRNKGIAYRFLQPNYPVEAGVLVPVPLFAARAKIY
jgi:hypothetical protein